MNTIARPEVHQHIPVSEAISEPTTTETQVIAIYGKGGIGKSFTLANLSYMMAQQGKRVLLIGCDPKSDTTSLLFGGGLPDDHRDLRAKEGCRRGSLDLRRLLQGDGVFAMELGGPEVGRGCGGRGIIHGFELLEKLGFHDWGFDYVLLDFLGDVVGGGFGLPIARDMCQKVIVVGSNDLQSLYVANNVCSAVLLPQARRQRRRRRHGQQGRRHGRSARFAEAAIRSFLHPRARGDPPKERELPDHRPPVRVGAALRELPGRR